MKSKKNGMILSMLLAAVMLNGCGSNNSSKTESEGSGISSAAEENSTEQSETEDSPAKTDAPSDSSSTEKTAAITTATEVHTDENGETYVAYVTDAPAQSADQPAVTQPAPDSPQTLNAPVRLQVETVKAKAGQEGVPVKISIDKNSGLSNGGITIDHSAELKPQVTDSEGTLLFEVGSAWQSTMTAGTTNETDTVHRVAFAFFSENGKNINATGTVFTCYFDVPANAKPGTEYKLDIEPNKFQSEGNDVTLIDAIDGAIIIE